MPPSSRSRAFITTISFHLFLKEKFTADAFFATWSRSNTVTPQMYFDFHDDPIVIQQERYDALLDWVFCVNKPPLAIKKSQIGHGHGLFATQNLLKGDVAFKIPKEKCLHLQACLDHPTLGKALATMEGDLEEDFASIVTLSAFLASEMLKEQCAEWEEEPTLGSSFGPYVSILPKGRGVSEQDHVLWWSKKEVNDIFDGASLEKALALREFIDMESSIIEGMLVSDLAQKNMGLSISQVRGSVTNAFVNVLSRSFFVGQKGDQRLVPVLDMCQHSNNPNLKYEINGNGDTVITTATEILAGEELTARYYSTEFEGHEFYVMYGFVVPFYEPAHSS